MMKQLKSQSGFTLVELTIVIALLGIVTVMVASFATLVNEHTIEITKHEEILKDVSNVQDNFNDWISIFDNDEYTFFIINSEIDVYDYSTEDTFESLTDELYAFKTSDYEDYILNNPSASMSTFVKDPEQTLLIYRFFLRQDGLVLGTNPVEDMNFSGTIIVNSLNFNVEANPNNNNSLLVSLEVVYKYLSATSKKFMFESQIFYKTTKCNVNYGGRVNE